MEKELKKKICFVVPRAWYLFEPQSETSGGNVGGAQKQAYLLSLALAKTDLYDVHFMVADYGQGARMLKNGITVWKSFQFQDNFIKKIIVFFSVLTKIKSDIYIFRAADFGVAISIFFIKFILQKKTLYMLASQKEIDYKTHKKKSGLLTACSMYFAYKLADVIVAQTSEQYYHFKANYKREPNAIIKNIIEQNTKERMHPDAGKHILWVGRLDPIKKPERYIELAKKFKDATFLMIAPMVLEHQKYGQNFLKRTDIPKNLLILPYVNPSEIKVYYQQAKIYVMTSESEGFSNTMMEAMEASCPILSYEVNPENMINLHGLGYCANGSKEDFYYYFERLLRDENAAHKMGKNGLKYITKNHRADIVLPAFINVIDNCIR